MSAVLAFRDADGVRTDTLDGTGTVIERRAVPPLDLRALGRAVAGLRGAIAQIPRTEDRLLAFLSHLPQFTASALMMPSSVKVGSSRDAAARSSC